MTMTLRELHIVLATISIIENENIGFFSKDGKLKLPGSLFRFEKYAGVEFTSSERKWIYEEYKRKYTVSE